LREFAAGFDRPLDVTTGPDGALYVADFGAGVIVRFGK
jgi:glucose/arabinose dehydrogenase